MKKRVQRACKRGEKVADLVWLGRNLLSRTALVVMLVLSLASLRSALAQDTPQRVAPNAVPQSLQDKVQRLQGLLERLQGQGADVQPIGDLMQGFGPLMQEQKFPEAEALVDRALKLAGGMSPQAGKMAPEQTAIPSGPRALHPQNQLWGTLHISIVDHESGHEVNARCYLTDSDGQHWSPSRATTYVKPLEQHFLVSDGFYISLPPGTYTLQVERGTEYQPVRRSIEIHPTVALDEKIGLERWINMNARGWYSGDLHNHRNLTDVPALLLAEDLNLAATFTTWIFGYRDMPTIKPDVMSAAVRAVDSTHAYSVFDTEIEGLGPIAGAIGLVGLRSPLNLNLDRLTSVNTVYTEMAHRQGGFVDAEKITWRDGVALIALGQVDFAGVVYNSFTPHGVELGWGINPTDPEYKTPAGAPLWAMDLYYKFLNCGFKLPVSAGTASGVKAVPLGYDRVYVKLPGKFSYQEWFRALKAGRSFATNGPMIFLTVNGQEPGSTIVFPPSSGPSDRRLRVHVDASASGHLERLEVISKGHVIKTVEADGEAHNLSADVQMDAQSGGWIAARAFEKPTETVRFGHTSPVYVRVGQDDGIVTEDAKYLADLVEQQIQYCKTAPGLRSEADRQAMIAMFRKAKAVYARLAAGKQHGEGSNF